MQDLGYYNQNGWGLLWYDYTDSGMQLNPNHIFRSHIRADQDSIFNDVMSIMYNSEPRIIMGHVRNASNLPTIDDPHPFIMRYGGKDYSFSHNGTVDTTYIKNLITTTDSTWLTQHPLTYYGNKCVDSELYFSWIMLNIHLQYQPNVDGDIVQGIKNALSYIYYYALNTNDSHKKDLNFILSDGMDIYAYMYTDDNTHPLAYFYDLDTVKRNHFYTGVMSQFLLYDPNISPINWSSDMVVHPIENNELVYISSTGNIVRLPDFGNQNLNALYKQKMGFHQDVNWSGFPILHVDVDGNAPVEVLNNFTHTINGGLSIVRYGDGPNDYVEWIFDRWVPPGLMLNQKHLYKLTFLTDSPTIHGELTTSLWFHYASLINPNEPVLDSVCGNQSYWISYTLLPSQNIKDAFGPSWSNVKTVRAEDWFYSIPPVDPKGGPPEAEPVAYSWTTAGKNMNFGKGYIVTFKNDQPSFTWNRSYAPEPPSPEKEKSVLFTWTDKEDYVVIDVLEVENPVGIEEIGVFQGNKCIGAVKTDTLPCQILIYPDTENPIPISFQIVYGSKAQPSNHYSYQVFDQNTFAYSPSQIIPENEGVYQVKLTGTNAGETLAGNSIILSASNYPNPFNPETHIYFTLTGRADVNVHIYNIKGQMVKEFGKKTYNVGFNTIRWDGKDNNNIEVSSGLYFLKIDSGNNYQMHKMLLLK